MTGSLLLMLAAGAVLGGAIGWLAAAARERAVRARVVAEAERGRAVAETRAAELARQMEGQRALLAEAEARLADTFRAAAADALAANNQGFLTLASEALVAPVRESLERVGGHIQELERERGQAYGRLTQLVQQMAAAQERLQAETGNLARALRAPAVRGRWGEVQLRRVVEIAGMVEHCDFAQQHTLSTDEGARLRPDLVVRLPGGRQVAVDAKVPLEAYLDALEAATEEERRERLEAHAAQVRAHVHKLSSKAYWAELGASPEFVVMFLPSEGMYGAALERMPSLIEEGASRRVLVTTPTTLIALLQTVHHGWRQERLADNAQRISEQGRILHERLAVLLEHWGKLGQALGRATEHFNAAVASFDARVLPAARRLEELGADSKKPVPDLRQIEARPRSLAPVEDEAPVQALAGGRSA